MIVEIESNVLNKIPNNLIWLSHNQIVDLIKKDWILSQDCSLLVEI